MEAMVGISLYSYFYLKLEKILSPMFSLQQNQRIRGVEQVVHISRVGGWGR
jgi:hypothetical protein